MDKLEEEGVGLDESGVDSVESGVLFKDGGLRGGLYIAYARIVIGYPWTTHKTRVQ